VITGEHDDSHETGDNMSEAPALTIGQAASRLGVDVQVVRRWVRTEQCPTMRIGRATRVPAWWVAEQLSQAGS